VPAGGAASVTVLRAAERTAVPWKNGGGVTREVAVSPAGSALGAFDWRVSIAEVEVAGPFSSFPGIDRRMAVLRGRLTLFIDGQPAVTLSPGSAAVSFPGEVPVFAEPLGGSVTDLNVMTRRGRFSAALTRCTVAASLVLPADATTTLLIAGSALRLRCGPEDFALAPLDAMRLMGRCDCGVACPAGEAGYFHLIRLAAAGPKDPAPRAAPTGFP
jgi:uncharacterized protein